MDAKETCETVLSYIKKSNLNWNIVESPFSVTVTIRKSFIKNKNGSSLGSGLVDLEAGHGKPNHKSNLTKDTVSSSMLHQTLVNFTPFPNKSNLFPSKQQVALTNPSSCPTKKTLSSSTNQQQTLGSPNFYHTQDTLSSNTMQQQDLGFPNPTKDNIFNSSMKKHALGNPYPYSVHDILYPNNMHKQAQGSGINTCPLTMSTDMLNNERPSSLYSSTKLSSMKLGLGSDTTIPEIKSSTEQITASPVDHSCGLHNRCSQNPFNNSYLGTPKNSSMDPSPDLTTIYSMDHPKSSCVGTTKNTTLDFSKENSLDPPSSLAHATSKNSLPSGSTSSSSFVLTKTSTLSADISTMSSFSRFSSPPTSQIEQSDENHKKKKEKVRKSWQCEFCEQTYPWGLTMDQALHTSQHLKKN